MIEPFVCCFVCVCLCCLFNFSLVLDCVMFVCTVLSHPYKYGSCGLWQRNFNFGDLDNSLVYLESEMDLNHMGNLFDLNLKQVLFYLTHYGP